jgi:hypothetical protein
VGCSQAHNEVFNQLRKKRNFRASATLGRRLPRTPCVPGSRSLMSRNGFIVIHQRDLVGNRAYGRSHTAPLFLN